MSYTYNDLVDAIKTRGAIPTGQATFTTARFLASINATMRTKILPLVLGVQENYYVYDQETALNDTGIYPIPKRAVVGKLNNAALLNGTERFDLPWISEERLQDTNIPPIDVVAGIYIKRNSAILVPKEGAGYATLQLSFFLRPAQIVQNTDAAQITAIDTATKTLTFAAGTIPTGWTTSNLFELVQADPHFDTLGYELSATLITSTTVVMSAALPDRLAVGDWLSLNGQTPVIQCPVELQPLLEQEGANFCLRSQGDLEAYKAGKEEAKEMHDDMKKLLAPRIQKEGKKIVNNTGILRRRG